MGYGHLGAFLDSRDCCMKFFFEEVCADEVL